MFTKETAVSFVQNSWGIERIEDRLLTDRKALLEEIIVQMQINVPFQSVTFMAVPPAQRVRPSTTTIKEECMSGVGGLCYNLNVFAWYLLKSLGFSTELCPATCTTTTTSPDNHILVLINDLEKQGDRHLVDCGSGFPTFSAIPLDFEEESPVYVDSFIEYKFIRRQGQILRMHGKGDPIKRNDPPIEGLDFFVGRWRRFYYLTVRPTDALSDFDAVFDRVFTIPAATPFDSSPRCLAFPGRRAVILVNNRLMVENSDGELETSVLEDDKQIMESYQRYFPILTEDAVRQALIQWHSLKK